MPLHLLIAPDSFKACLSATAVAQAMAEGVRSVMPDAKISLCPLSDGGEGLTDVLAARRPHIMRPLKNGADNNYLPFQDHFCLKKGNYRG